MNHVSTASDAPDSPSNIERKLDRVYAESERMEHLVARARTVLKPALTPESTTPGGAALLSGEGKAIAQSPLAEQLDSLAYKLERQGNDLRDLLDRFEA